MEIKEQSVDGFVKLDGGKPRGDLFMSGFPNAILAVSSALGFGAKKCSENNWLLGELYRYEGAAIRHLAAHHSGEEIDPESGMPHLHHFATNAILFYNLISEFNDEY